VFYVVFFTKLQATHGIKGTFFCMDRKTKIPIASLLARIEVALKKKYGKAAGFLTFLDSKLSPSPATRYTSSGYRISSR
jgi:hypothetical protein